MDYPIAIELGGPTTAFGVVVPDLPGCFSAGDTLEDAMAATVEAVVAWIDATLDAGGVIPAASSLETFRSDEAFRGWTFATVRIDQDMLATRGRATPEARIGTA